jgi:hypothetical protein
MRAQTRWTVIAASLVAALFPGPVSAELNATDSARQLYPILARRHWLLAE